MPAVSLFANLPGGGNGTGPNVTLTDGGSTVTMANGIISIVCVKTTATLTQINYTYNNSGTLVTNQLLNGGKDGGEFYWETGGFGTGTFAYSIVANTGDYCEIDLVSSSTTNGVMDVHFSMLRGSPGFYVTAIWSHRNGDVAMGMGETRDNIYLAPEFTWNSIDANRNFQYNLGGAGGGGSAGQIPVFGAPQEVSLWTNGLEAGRYEDKYKYTADFGTERVWGWSSVNNSAAGFTGQNIGIWHILASPEYYNGGPMKPELMDAPMVNMLNGDHYEMGSNALWGANEVWTRVSGPYFIYCNAVTNTITNPFQTAQALYADAQAQAQAEATAWPYDWFTNAAYAPASQRGTVSGQIVINDAGNPHASASNLWVGLVRQPVTVDDVYDFQQWMKPYQFWTRTDTNGNFTIPNVIATNGYTLYAFGPGAAGTFMSQPQTGGNPPLLYDLPSAPFGVTATAEETNNLGSIVWTPSRVGATVFEIGYPDRTARKFRHGEDWWVGDVGPDSSDPSPIWSKFLEYPFDFPNGPNYVVGQSRWTTDWNFCQPVVTDGAGNYDASSSTITFNLTQAPTNGAVASLYLALCSDYSGPVIVSVNGNNLSGVSGLVASPISSIPSTGFFPSYNVSDTTIREGINAAFSDERLTFPASLLQAGQNTITLGLRSRDYFADHFMYDYLRLELTGYVPPSPASVIAFPGNNCNLLAWPVVPGATGYNVLRSSTSGSGYVSITNDVTGPVCGCGLNDANYLDPTATNGTTYYYVVQAINPTGVSASSSSSGAAAPSAVISTNPPAVPTGLTIGNAGHQNVALTWNASPGASFYTIQRSTLFNNFGGASNTLDSIVLANNVTGTSYTDTSPTDGSIYSYSVSATGPGGVSDNSTPAVAVPLPAPPATAPAGITVSGGSAQTNYFIQWQPVAGAVGYIVRRGTAVGGPFNYVMSITETNWTDAGLNPGSQYFYTITAVNAGGTAGSSVVAGPPGIPAGLVATPGNAQILLTWPAAPGATNYIIKRGTSSGNETTNVASDVAGTSYSDTGLVNGMTYYYVVQAGGPDGISGDSSEASATPDNTAFQGLTWTGAASPIWDTTSTNWLDNLTATNYADGDVVTFDDSAVSFNVVVSNAVFPGLVTFTNVTHNYSVGESAGGGISGTASLVKDGAGSLTLSNANAYSGGTVLNAGTLALDNAGSAGTNLITLNGGTLILGAVISNPINVPATATLSPGNIDYNSSPLFGNGTLNINITGGNTFSPQADLSGFSGTIELGTSTGYCRFYGSLGSAAAVFDLGTATATLLNRNGGVSIQLGALAGGAETSLTGASSVNAPTTYIVGGANTNTTFSGRISDNAGTTAIVKTGLGTWTVGGANTYSAGTTINGGTLLVINATGSGTGSGNVAVNSGGTLAGAGIIAGPVSINTGGTLSPGSLPGTLTISNTLTLAPGSTTALVVQPSSFTNSSVFCSGNLSEAGTLVITNLGSALVNGATFKLFTAPVYTGSFSNFILPTLAAGLLWNTNTLNVSGILSVVMLTAPSIRSLSLSGTALDISGTGGAAEWPFYVLATTNLASPLAQWVPVATNHFDAAGNFIITNPVPASSQVYYRLKLE